MHLGSIAPFNFLVLTIHWAAIQTNWTQWVYPFRFDSLRSPNDRIIILTAPKISLKNENEFIQGLFWLDSGPPESAMHSKWDWMRIPLPSRDLLCMTRKGGELSAVVSVVAHFVCVWDSPRGCIGERSGTDEHHFSLCIFFALSTFNAILILWSLYWINQCESVCFLYIKWRPAFRFSV